jgi:hypothetical protein
VEQLSVWSYPQILDLPKNIATDKNSGLFGLFVSDKDKKL